MRYLSLAEALVIAEAVTGIDCAVLAKSAGIGLLDSALHAPQASFGGQEFYPDLAQKAAVLMVRLARNHPLPDGNKRLAWACLRMFVALNDRGIDIADDEAVDQMLAIAAGEVDEPSMSEWLTERLK